ncbi:tubby-like F-box protein 2 [Vicia villosa]|uniref:tubby-like F-box protein 2 n=1 Tax=Vicia villosa TaxID=3911 RepID=UPI00273C0D79|nr:tubby-like F-box protein 2 [Vicia villosa]
MSLKSIVSELKGIKNRLSKLCRGSKSDVVAITPTEPIQQGQWASLPPELLSDIIRRLEESETSWPERTALIFCASVCKSWRSVTKEIIKGPQQHGQITFPISLKLPGPSVYAMRCFIKRNKKTSTFLLYLDSVPAENESSKLLLAAKRIRRTKFVISLAADDFSRARDKYVGKLRSNFWGTKFTIYDGHPSIFDETSSPSREPKGKRPMKDTFSVSLSEPLERKYNAPGWDEQRLLRFLDDKDCAVVSSIRNYELLAVLNGSRNVSPLEQENVILHFGKTPTKDIYIMDYYYPLSAFQAFAICLTAM